MEIKSVNTKLKKSEIVKQLGGSSTFLQQYGQDIKMLSPYRIPPNSNSRKQNISTRKHELERPQIISSGVKRPQKTSK